MGFRIADPLDQDIDMYDGYVVELCVSDGDTPWVELYCFGQPVWECTDSQHDANIWLQLDLTRGHVQLRVNNRHFGIVYTLPTPVLTPVVAACRNVYIPVRLL